MRTKLTQTYTIGGTDREGPLETPNENVYIIADKTKTNEAIPMIANIIAPLYFKLRFLILSI